MFKQLIIGFTLCISSYCQSVMFPGPGVSKGGSSPTGYLHCKTITLAGSMISGGSNLTNFPVSIILPADNDLKVGGGGFVQNSSGFDIGFYDSCATGASALTWDMESYDSTTGALVAHVKMPTLHTTGDTIGMAFDGAQGAYQSTASSVWDANFVGIWHLGTSLSLVDSTTSAHTLTNQGSMSAATGQVDGGAIGTGTPNQGFTNASTTLLVTTDYTISGWIKKAVPDYILGDYGIVSQWDNASGFKGYQLYDSGSGTWRVYADTNHFNSGSAAPNDGLWHHIVGVKSGSTGLIYIDGVSTTGAIGGSTITSPGVLIGVGRYGFLTNSNGSIQASMDEVRISNIARTAGEIITNYRNQATPSTYITVGGLQ